MRATANQETFVEVNTFTALLKDCAQQKDLQKGIEVHADILTRGLFGKSLYVANALVAMYAKCGAFKRAEDTLAEIPVPDVVSWSGLIAGYVQHWLHEEALCCFEQMQLRGISPNAATFVSVLKACGRAGAADTGEKLYLEIVGQGLLKESRVLGNALVDMYISLGAVAKAEQVFEDLFVRDVVSWSSLIAGYVQYEDGEEAMNCYERMQCEGVLPNEVTFISTLKACASIRAYEKGEKIRTEIFKLGLLEKNTALGNTLLDMYVRCGAFAKAQEVLQELPVCDVVSWSVLISGYVQFGCGVEAINCYSRMLHEGLSPDAATFVCILKACGSIGAIADGEKVHAEIVREQLLQHDVGLGTALMDMYAKCGAIENAQEVMSELHVRNTVSWNALITGYAQLGHGQDAFKCYWQMRYEGSLPDTVTFACILKACGSIGAADKGEMIHAEIVMQGFLKKSLVLGSALVDMYAKCGALSNGRRVLCELPAQDAVSWSALIAGYAQHGHGKEALSCFECMLSKGFFPDAVTFASVLNACSHAGLLNEGQFCFSRTMTKYGIKPNLVHYTCMIDLFGRAGHFEKVVALIKKIPSSECTLVWDALLGGCQNWRNRKLGRVAFEHTLQLDETHSAAYVCMSNICATEDPGEHVNYIRALMELSGCVKCISDGVGSHSGMMN